MKVFLQHKFLLLVLCITLLVVSGCSGSSNKRIGFHKRGHKVSRSHLVVRGQLHKQPSSLEKDLFIWPTDKGIVMSGFGIRRGRRHDGIDISAKSGSKIYAAADGKVVFNGRMRGYGNLVLIRHDNNYFTAYAHNKRNIAKKGTHVKQGELIALVGRTGRSTGNHIHFEIRRGQKAMDPMDFLPAKEGILVKKSLQKKRDIIAKKSSSEKEVTTSKDEKKGVALKEEVAKLKADSNSKVAAVDLSKKNSSEPEQDKLQELNAKVLQSNTKKAVSSANKPKRSNKLIKIAKEDSKEISKSEIKKNLPSNDNTALAKSSKIFSKEAKQKVNSEL